ncbi:coiled-coil domain-containing protein 191-like isoform X2 [Hydractinia symbiolongicarpus]|uniref:coiled-coil domain-containing protein 191-like isoform X2 n=1 Tax=Hydractinia symbiolongicarpus TaxID=13093 RepID=UPI00254C9998|nr:coiled-coil domain-containing protein 191-like isoform X2 [Hydractinia symbiolongicarpus]
MANHHADLFKWKRKTNPMEMGRKGKKDKMKDWIKKVQDASERAALEAYGSDIFETDHLGEFVPDDEALYEAQELLDGWLQEKTFPNMQHELEHKKESWSSNKRLMLDADTYLHGGNKNKVDYLTDFRNTFLDIDTNHEEEEEIPKPIFFPEAASAAQDYTNYLLEVENIDNDDIDDSLVVQEVLRGMMNKEVVKNIDLGMKPLVRRLKDPVPKMNLRHQQVKIKGAERKSKVAAKKLELSTQKEIEQKARAKVAEEEKQKKLKEKAEEKAIKLEMVRIRKELEDEKRKRFEESERKKKILDEAKLQMQKELRRKKEHRKTESVRRKEAEEQMRLHVEYEAEKKSLEELKQNMQILHKHFSLWYNLVLETRIKVGKARAVADWKCKLKAWNAWKAYVTCVRSCEEARTIEQSLKEKYRKEQMAIKYSNKKLLHTCFISWLKYARYQVEKKILLAEHEKKAKKMAMFLEAASKGLLWKDKKECNASSDEKIVLTNEKVNDQQLYQTHLRNKTQKIPTGKSHFQKHKEKRNEEVHQHNKMPCKDVENITRQNSVYTKKTKSVVTENYMIQHNIANPFSAPLIKHSIGAKNDVLHDANPTRSDPAESVVTVPIKHFQVRSQKQTTKPLHLAMEERESQRRERKAQLEEQKRKKEEEKLNVLRKREEERLRKEELEKEERIKQRKEQRRLEIQKEKEKQLRQEQARIKTNLATTHYQNFLLRKYGLEPLTRLIQVVQLNLEISNKYCSGRLLKIVFVSWYTNTKEDVTEKKNKADHCYEKILLRRSLRSWQKVRFNLQMLNKIARKHNIQRIKKHAFNAWQDYVTDERILMWAKESSADEHNQARITKLYFHTLVNFVSLVKEERVREKRKNDLRKKVQQWLPDFQGKTESV